MSTEFKSKKRKGKDDDRHQLKLSNFVDVQQLLHIGYRNSELLPLIKRVSVINEIFPNFNTKVQNELISIIKIVERTVKDFVDMKQTSNDSHEIEKVVHRLLPRLGKSFCAVVLKHGGFILDPATKNLVEWNKLSKSLSKKKTDKKSNDDLYDLSCRFQVKDLIKIGKDHPEFRSNIKTIISVSTAMKHLNHSGQVEIYKILQRMEKIIKDLVKQKTDTEASQDIFLTPDVLTSNLDLCIEKILKLLKAVSPTKTVKCYDCDLDRCHARYVDNEPIIERRHLEFYKCLSVFGNANLGVDHDRINNLESLIHHLVSKENCLEEFWSFEERVDWSKISFLYSRYRLETIPDTMKVFILRMLLMEALENVDYILVHLRSFSEEMEQIAFGNNENLSDALALGGQIETVSSNVEQYLMAFTAFTGEVFSLLQEYSVVSSKLRKNRFQFLTRPQWNAFNFPFEIK